MMFIPRVHRYIATEVLAPTSLCLLIFTMVLLMGRLVKLVDMVVNKGVSISDILVLFGTMLPTFLNVTLPLAFLMGIMIGLGRMSADSETIALKAAGIGLGQLARPVMALALLCAILTGAASLWLKPWGYQAFQEQVFAITKQKATVGFQSQVFMNQFDNMVLYADKLDDRSGLMSGLFLVEKGPEATSLIFANQGNIIANEEEETITFRLHDGTIHRQQSENDSSYQLIHFRNYDVQPDLTSYQDVSTTRSKRKRPKQMSTRDLWQDISAGTKAGIEPDKRHSMQAELHTRLCSPLAPLLFALFGLPFSIQSHRSGRSGGFVMGLIIYLFYHLMLSLAETVTAEAGVAPWITFWLPHFFLTLLGLYCLKQSAHEQPNIVLSWVEQGLINLKKRHKVNDDHR